MNEAAGQIESGNSLGKDQAKRAPLTVEENLTIRIAHLQGQMDKLIALRRKFASGCILDMSVEELQMAMGRYI